MKSASAKYLLIGLALFTVILLSACAKPAPTPPSAAEFEISSLVITPDKTTPGQPVTITVDVENVGGSKAAHSVTLTIDGIKAQTKVINIASRAVEEVFFTVIEDKPKIYQVQVNGLAGTFQILKPATFTISNLAIAPASVNVGQEAMATVDVSNTGEVESSYSVVLTIDEAQVETKETIISAGATKTVGFTLAQNTPGLYEVNINGLERVLKVWGAVQTPLDIHKESWLSMLSKAETDRYYSYAIYASRTLAVKHPEVYLQGDDIFARVITTTPGMKKAYVTRDVHSQYFMELQLQGDSFSFDDVDFNKYELLTSKEICPPDYPFLSFFDRRLAPISISLKTFDNRITQLEKAEQLYFKAKHSGANDLFLLYCDNENAYLYGNGSLIWAENQEKVNSIEGNPVLIFNERHVWYPLMERNDTDKSELLKKLVAQYSTAKKEPELSDFESSLLDKLRRVTEAKTAERLTYLKLVSILYQWTMRGLLPAETKAELDKLGIPLSLPCRPWMEKRNLISPISAYLAATTKLQEGPAEVEALCSEYLCHAALPGESYAHGFVWMSGMVRGGLDDSYRTRAGICVEQAANIGAALELAGIDSYTMEGLADSGNTHHAHDFIYIPKYDLIISNGRIRKNASEANTVLDCHFDNLEYPYKYLDFIEHNGKWAWIYPGYFGTLSPEETLEMITHLRGIHGDDIQSGERPPPGEKMWQGKLKAISYEQLKQYLLEQQEHWTPYQLP